jgi:THO complex subunit 1
MVFRRMSAPPEVEGSVSKPDELPTLPFAQLSSQFMQSVKLNFAKNNIQGLEETNKELVSRDKENKKLALDQCLREYQARELIIPAKNQVEFDVIQKYVRFVVQAAQHELCTVSTPIHILGDVFDLLPLAKCEIFFKIVEKEVATWKSPSFYSSIKNNLLRICNDLLRRLSRTQNTVFCGRILLFLAKFFPFSERSGLNVISEFNLDNYTAYTKELPKPEEKAKEESNGEPEDKASEDKPEEKDEASKESAKTAEEKTVAADAEKKSDEVEAMEIELIVEEKEKMEVEKKDDDKESKSEREFKLYSNFWQLQDFFRDPAQCYDKNQWENFCNITAEIISTFTKKKLDTRTSKKEPLMKETADEFVEEYFPKYLTNQNLLNLQLNDSNFRRYVLMQYLIVFQYLQTSVKFKTDTQVLSTDQGKWIDEQRKKAFKLLDETPPNGKAFSSSAKSILKRELIWIRWKNEGCPSLVIPSPPAAENGEAEKEAVGSTPEKKARLGKRKAPLGEMMRYEAKHGKINLGNKGLTKLWNINPDNLEACKEEERNFLPSLLQFFEEPINELNPHNGIDDVYKKVNKGEWGWRALRLMSRRSNHFFLVGNSHIGKLPEYLSIMMKKMATDFDINIEEPTDGEANGMDTTNGSGDKSTSMKLTDDQLTVLAGKLAESWEKLVPKFGLTPEKVDECKAGADNEERCLKLLKAWVQEEGEGASPDEITYILGSLKLNQLIEGVF